MEVEKSVAEMKIKRFSKFQIWNLEFGIVNSFYFWFISFGLFHYLFSCLQTARVNVKFCTSTAAYVEKQRLFNLYTKLDFFPV